MNLQVARKLVQAIEANTRHSQKLHRLQVRGRFLNHGQCRRRLQFLEFCGLVRGAFFFPGAYMHNTRRATWNRSQGRHCGKYSEMTPWVRV